MYSISVDARASCFVVTARKLHSGVSDLRRAADGDGSGPIASSHLEAYPALRSPASLQGDGIVLQLPTEIILLSSTKI